MKKKQIYQEQLKQPQELLIPTVDKLLFVLNPDFVAKSSQLRVLIDGRAFPIKQVSCHYVYSDDLKKTVFLEV